uniref:Uncharacterized protein n=1 Tax=Dendroctonus ponderosae TaxID=77166 RepID=A0AAR5QCI5_DENPD
MENAEKIKSVSERSPLVADSASIGADIPTNNFPEISKPEKTEQLSSESDEPRKNKPSMVVKFAVIFAKKVLILLIGYIFCYFNWSLTLPIVGILSLIWYENLKPQKGDRIRKKLWASSMSKADICDVVKDLPSWVNDQKLGGRDIDEDYISGDLWGLPVSSDLYNWGTQGAQSQSACTKDYPQFANKNISQDVPPVCGSSADTIYPSNSTNQVERYPARKRYPRH